MLGKSGIFTYTCWGGLTWERLDMIYFQIALPPFIFCAKLKNKLK